MKKNPRKQEDNPQKKEQLPGDPVYSANEDIYSQEKKEELNEEELPGKHKKKPASSLDEGLDVPGAELDDADEIIGEEDEENNYYSIGGDDHSDLDEDKDG